MKRFFVAVGAIVALIAVLGFSGWVYFNPDLAIEGDSVVYGERGGKPLKLEVFQPKRPNGKGIIIVVSGYRLE